MFSLLANDESDNEERTQPTVTTETNVTTETTETTDKNIPSHEDIKMNRVRAEKSNQQITDEEIQKEFEPIERDRKNRRNRNERNETKFERNERNESRNENKTDSSPIASDFVQNVFRDEKLLENKVIFDENKNYGDIGEDKKLNSYWTVWVHKINSNDWTLTGYQKIYVINSIGSFWRFFNNLQLLNTYQNQIFIMREEIAPIWEDVNNKFGGICSVKIDSIQKGMKTDLSTEVLVLISLLIMNETFVANNKNINGISYSVKKRSSLIKVWTKTFSEEHDFTKDLPVPLMNKFNSEMQKQSKNVLNNDGKISVQYKQIKPEFE
jgi:hypothetical protein